MSIATAIALPSTRRELAHRESGGIEVTLYWDAREDSVEVEVHHRATEETICFAVAREEALDAFHHPFAHLTRRTGRGSGAATARAAAGLRDR
jgi:hypothetical protein